MTEHSPAVALLTSLTSTSRKWYSKCSLKHLSKVVGVQRFNPSSPTSRCAMSWRRSIARFNAPLRTRASKNKLGQVAQSFLAVFAWTIAFPTLLLVLRIWLESWSRRVQQQHEFPWRTPQSVCCRSQHSAWWTPMCHHRAFKIGRLAKSAQFSMGEEFQACFLKRRKKQTKRKHSLSTINSHKQIEVYGIDLSLLTNTHPHQEKKHGEKETMSKELQRQFQLLQLHGHLHSQGKGHRGPREANQQGLHLLKRFEELQTDLISAAR